MSSDQPEENKPIDFSKTEDLRAMTEHGLITNENWQEAKDSLLSGGVEYITGQEHMVKILKRLLELELPFDELKKQLTGVVTEREKFITYAWKNSD